MKYKQQYKDGNRSKIPGYSSAKPLLGSQVDTSWKSWLGSHTAIVVLVSFINSAIIGIFLWIYLIFYIDVDIFLGSGIATGTSLLLFALNFKASFIRAAFLLMAPEISARTVRILVVHFLMVYAPLAQLQSNSETFFKSIVCTSEKSLGVAKNSSEGVLRNIWGGVQGSIEGINSVSDKLQNFLDGPLGVFEGTLGGVETVLNTLENGERICLDANSKLNSACKTVLNLPAEGCRHLGGKRRKRFSSKVGGGISTALNNVSKEVEEKVPHSGIHANINTVKTGFRAGMKFSQSPNFQIDFKFRRTKRFWDNISRGVQSGIKTVSDGVRTGANGVARDAQTGYNNVLGGVQQGYRHAHQGVRDGVDWTKETTLSISKSVCNSLSGISKQCNEIQINKVCDAFQLARHARRKLTEFKDNTINKIRQTFLFKFLTAHESSSDIGNHTFSGVKKQIKENLQMSIDYFLSFKRIWGIILSLSVIYLLISKVLLVRKFNRNGTIKCKLISTIFLLTNPFVLQICFLILIGVLHSSFYFIHNLFRDSMLTQEIKLGVNFNASVTLKGGEIGTEIARWLIRAFDLRKSIQTTVNFEECFRETVEPPSLLEYLIVVGTSALGILTYGVDILCRRKQTEMAKFVLDRK